MGLKAVSGQAATSATRGCRLGRRVPTPTTTTHNNRVVGDQDINLPRRIRAHVQAALPVKRHAHGPEAGAGAFGGIRIGEDVRVGGVTRRRGDGFAVDEVDERYFVADGLAAVPVFLYVRVG